MTCATGKRKLGNFNPEWEQAFFCRDVGGLSQCIVCRKQVVVKLYNIKRHYDAFHKHDYKSIEGEERKALYFKLYPKVECKIKEETEHRSVAAVRASYEIALQLARSNRDLADGELVKSCLLTAVEILDKEQLPKYNEICLSGATISSRVQEMAQDSGRQLKLRIASFVAVSLAFHSSDVADNAPQLAVFIRGVDAELNVTEELLDLIEMKDATSGGDVFKLIDDSVSQMGLPWRKVISVATDGSRSMTGFIERLRQKFEEEALYDGFVAVHCFVHHEALCATALNLQNVMSTVVKCVNALRHRHHALHDREFKDFLELVEIEQRDIPNCTDVRWLSRGSTLKRFFELRVSIYVLLKQTKNLVPELLDDDWIADLGFMTDITTHLNNLNGTLLGQNQLIFQMSDEIESFKSKLVLWKWKLGENNFDFFPCLESLAAHQTTLNGSRYAEKLTELENEFNRRFAELTPLKPEFEIFAAPFAADAYNAPRYLQMEVIELQCDTRAKANYKESSCILEFYESLSAEKFPNLHKLSVNIIAMFGSSYTCEQFISNMKRNKSRSTDRVSDQNMTSIMRLSSAVEILPDVDALVAKKTRNDLSEWNK